MSDDDQGYASEDVGGLEEQLDFQAKPPEDGGANGAPLTTDVPETPARLSVGPEVDFGGDSNLATMDFWAKPLRDRLVEKFPHGAASGGAPLQIVSACAGLCTEVMVAKVPSSFVERDAGLTYVCVCYQAAAGGGFVSDGDC